MRAAPGAPRSLGIALGQPAGPVAVAAEDERGRADQSPPSARARPGRRVPRGRSPCGRGRGRCPPAGGTAAARPATAPADRDDVEVAQVRRRGDRHAQRPAGAVHRAYRDRVAACRVVRRAPCPSAPVQPCSWAQAASPGPRAIASRQPRPPHSHGRPVRVDDHVPDVPGVAAGAVDEPPAEDEPAAHAGGDDHAEDVGLAAARRRASARRRPPRPRRCAPGPAGRGTARCSRSRSGNARHAGMLSGETSPDGHHIGPPQPTPMPASRLMAAACRSASGGCATGRRCRRAALWE